MSKLVKELKNLITDVFWDEYVVNFEEIIIDEYGLEWKDTKKFLTVLTSELKKVAEEVATEFEKQHNIE